MKYAVQYTIESDKLLSWILNFRIFGSQKEKERGSEVSFGEKVEIEAALEICLACPAP